VLLVGLVPTKAGAVSVRVVAVELVVVELVAVALVVEVLLCACELVEAADVWELVAEREELDPALVAAEVVLAVVLAGPVLVAVTAAGVLEPHAASVTASAAAASAVATGMALIGRGDGSRSQSVPPAVMVRRDGSESDGP
jgi:hypothetical protein